MIRETRYNGYTATPDDYGCREGDLASAMNLVPDHDALRPFLPPATLATLPEGWSVLCIHETSVFKHYLFKDGNEKIYWVPGSLDGADTSPSIDNGNLTQADIAYYLEGDTVNENTVSTHLSVDFSQVYGITPIGNTLAVLTSGGVEYFLWKEGAYLYLGQRPQPISVRYSVGKTARYEEAITTLTGSGSLYHLATGYFTQEGYIATESQQALSTISDTIFGMINKAREAAKEGGYFWYPFFIRLAYRTNTDHHIMHTAPFLVVPNADGKPFIITSQLNDGTIAIELPTASVLADISKIPDDWQDIITSIDIFMTPPLQAYTEDSAGMPNTTSGTSTDYPELIYMGGKESAGSFTTSTYYNSGGSHFRINLERADGKTMPELIREASSYYLYKRLKPSDFSGDRLTEQLSSEHIDTLVAREVLDDDWRSRDTIITDTAYVYNSRLNLIPRSVMPGTPDNVENIINPINPSTSTPARPETVEVDVDGFAVEVTREGVTSYSPFSQVGYDTIRFGPLTYTYYPRLADATYFFYPDQSAKAVIIRLKITDNSGDSEEVSYSYVKVSLIAHESLHGAYAFNDDLSSPLESGTQIGTGGYASDEKFYEAFPQYVPSSMPIQAQIRSSEVSDPFVFPLDGIKTIGTGKIIGVRAAAKALSPGQFGQFPLYAFTTDGVWALEVTSTGTFNPPKPITLDVCISADSITQLDTQVMFATDRGIMLLTGSSSECISDALDADAYNLPSLPSISVLLDEAGLTAADITYVPFKTFLGGLRGVYDYEHQHIIFYNENYQYAYVFSTQSKQWGMIESNLISTVNSYPEALAVTSTTTDDGTVQTLINFSDRDESANVNGLLISRPFKLGDPDMLKTIDTLIQRGYFDFHNTSGISKVQQILYGSRDLFNWHTIWSSQDLYMRGFRGTPYKYFRVAAAVNLRKGEGIVGFTAEFTPRHANRPR